MTADLCVRSTSRITVLVVDISIRETTEGSLTQFAYTRAAQNVH